MRIVLPEDIERLAVEIAQLIEAGGKSIRSERQVRRKDGSVFLCEVTSKQLLDGRLQAILRDVTETRRIQTQLQERQHFLQQVLDAEPGTVYIFDLAASSNIYINRHWLTSYGYSQEETAAMGAEALNRMLSDHDLARIAAHHDAWRQTGAGGIRDIEYHLRTKSGEWRWVYSRETAFARDNTGQVTQILGIAHDITERRRAETALRESENRLNIAQRIGAIGSWEWDLASDVITGSHQLYQLISVDPANADSNVLAMIDRCIHPGDSERVHRISEENRAQGKYLPLEFRVLKPDGTVRWVMSQGYVETGAHGRPVRLFGVLQDITARKHMEDALRDSERKLRLVIDGLGPSVFVGLMTPDGAVIVANHSALAAAGLSLEDVAGKPVEETYWFSYSASVQAQLRAAVTRAQRGESSRYDVPIRVADGVTIWIDLSFTPVLDAQGQVSFIVPSASVIDESKKLEIKLAASEALLRTIVDSEPACVKLINANGTLLEMNAAGLPMIEAETREQIIGKDVAQLVVPEHRDAFSQLQQRVVDGASGTLEFDVTGLKGTRHTLETHAAPLRDSTGLVSAALGLTADITERKRTAAENQRLAFQLQQAQKMEAIGQLTAGIEGAWLSRHRVQ